MSSATRRQNFSSEPAVSIVVCTRNRRSQLGQCIHALRSIESAAPFEIIIVDNGSTDGTAEYLAEVVAVDQRITMVSEPSAGLGRAQQRGIAASGGELIALTDDDCYPSPDYVDALVAAFADDPTVGVVGGRVRLYDPDDIPVTIDDRSSRVVYEPRTFIQAGSIQGASMAVRRSVLDHVGGPDPGLGPGTGHNCVDIDLVAAVVWAGYRAAFDPRPLVHHHHGRKLADEARLIRDYQRGRGVYYLRYVLRRDSGPIYFAQWMLLTVGRLVRRRTLKPLLHEVGGAVSYLRSGGRARPRVSP